MWEIERAAVKPRQSAATATTSDDRARRQATTTAADVAATNAAPDEGDRAENADRRNTAPDFRARYIAQMEAENSFLKSQLEDANRNAAELRVALRKALEIAPRQLPAAPTDASAAPETGQGRAPNDAATNTATGTDAAAKSPQNAKTRPSKREPRSFLKILFGLR